MKNMIAALALLLPALTACGTVPATSSNTSSLAAAAQPDLTRDLALPLGQLGTPFHGQADDVALGSNVKAALADLLNRCAVVPFHADVQGIETDGDATSLCPSELSLAADDETKLTSKVTFKLATGIYTAVAYDGLDSDGGDQSDVAVYDATGKRIAVRTALFVDQGVIGDLAALAGAPLKKVADAK